MTVSGYDGIVLVRPRVTAETVESGNGEAAAGPMRCRIVVDLVSQLVLVDLDGARHTIRRAPPPDANQAGGSRADGGAASLEAPMPGRVVRIAVAVGDAVREHQPLVIVEAMKIENTVAAPRDGVVAAIHCTEGEAVAGGQVLVELVAQ